MVRAHPGDLLLHHLGLGLEEEGQQHDGEVVGVRVGVAELVGHGVQKEVAALRVRLRDEPPQQREVGGALDALGGDGGARLLENQDPGLPDVQD